MNMNVQLCQTVLEIEKEIIALAQEQERLSKENDRTWDQLVWMAKGYLDRQWEVLLNSKGREYSEDKKTFVDSGSSFPSIN